MNIKIQVANKLAKVEGSPSIVCGNSDYSIDFTFDAEWEGEAVKTARFVYVQNGTAKYQDISFTGSAVKVPVLSNTREVKVGVFAGDLQTTTPARIRCEPSILCGSMSADPTPGPDIGDGGSIHTRCFDGSFVGEFVDLKIGALRYGAFAECKEITKISLPNCTKILGSYTFYNMTNVEEVSLPNVTSGTFAATFYYCMKVKKIDLSSLGGAEIGANCFRNCSALETLIFGGDKINTITSTTNAFQGASANMIIYVPEALYDAYIAHPSWDSYKDRIKKRPVSGGVSQ